jgi:hypothetical protein
MPSLTPARHTPTLRKFLVAPSTAFWCIALVRLAPRSEGIRPLLPFPVGALGEPAKRRALVAVADVRRQRLAPVRADEGDRRRELV